MGEYTPLRRQLSSQLPASDGLREESLVQRILHHLGMVRQSRRGATVFRLNSVLIGFVAPRRSGRRAAKRTLFAEKLRPETGRFFRFGVKNKSPLNGLLSGIKLAFNRVALGVQSRQEENRGRRTAIFPAVFCSGIPCTLQGRCSNGNRCKQLDTLPDRRSFVCGVYPDPKVLRTDAASPVAITD